MKKETHLTLRFLAEGIKMLFTSAGHREGRTDYFLCLCLSGGDSQQPQTTTWNSNTDSINTTCSCFLSCTSSSLASLSASSWRRLSCKNNFSSWTCYCVRRQENATTNLGDEELTFTTLTPGFPNIKLFHARMVMFAWHTSRHRCNFVLFLFYQLYRSESI